MAIEGKGGENESDSSDVPDVVLISIIPSVKRKKVC
ncbi:hypothetical protein COLO4_19870 [Corchorus olitorius]|uniref:Uncharacterized protein n=1 Tax=Corchorus olitorius TaxID=93759 RepID=A0A1R3J2X9_9ROSI|nr:hypothetical protein COLO4_19870 [Corchorus olitorius]